MESDLKMALGIVGAIFTVLVAYGLIAIWAG
ncbi:YnhF family membrane protein [Vibrio sp. SCSIO 43136]|nr:YnhF family membrane protein [Vibrio sp. SCSIO 43136]USD64401.1 YnhF family membrane protein [Vibrio sp. SCSIO 43136]